jgi:acyl-CoA thioesterase-1
MSRVFSSLALLALVACGSSPSTTTTPAPPGTPVAVVLGDSLTAGPGLSPSNAYPALLQQRARDAGYPHRVINAGVSGDTTADALRRLDAALRADTRVLVVALGANDGLQGVPVATVKRNLTEIIERAQGRNIRVLLAGMEAPPTRGFQYSVDFHVIFPDLAQQFDVPLMPFLLAGVFGEPSLNLPDGFHPNAAGMRVIADAMWPYLEPRLQATSAR